MEPSPSLTPRCPLMARVRQARRCRAHRTEGAPCRGWAMVGGFVCRAHGGTAPQVRYAAYVRATEAAIIREFEAAKARWKRDRIAWMSRRLLTVSRFMGIPVDEV